MANSFDKKLLYLDIVAISLYFLQGGLYQRGSLIPQVALLTTLLIDGYYMTKYFLSGRNNSIGIYITCFVALMTISWLISPKRIITGMVSYVTSWELKNMYLFMLSYYPFKYWSNQGVISESLKRKMALLFAGVFAYGFFVKQNEAANSAYWVEFVTNNGGYMIPLVFPLLGIFLEKWWSWILLAIAVILTLMSAKRGAIVCISVEALLFVHYKLKTGSNKAWTIFFTFISLVLLAGLTYKYISNDAFLLGRFQGDSSGRDSIYRTLWNLYANADYLEQLFGFGFLQTLEINGIFAHSDWLELIIDQGILGVVVYLLIFYSLIKCYFQIVNKTAPQYRFIYLAAVLCWSLKSIFSMGYNSPEASMLIIAIAISQNGLRLK